MAVFTGLGSAASPSITFSADTNTGIFSPGADQVAISTNGTGRLFVNASGFVGVNQSTPLDDVHIASANPAIVFDETDGTTDNKYWRFRANNGFLNFEGVSDDFGTTSAVLRFQRATASSQTDTIQFFTGASERARIGSSGRLLVGTSSALNVTREADGSQGDTLGVQNVGDFNSASLALLNFSGTTTNARPVSIVLGRSVGSGTTHTIVEEADELGVISFQGSDGAKFVRAASIKAIVDSATGANNMPGRLVFFTTPSGSATPVERMRIDSAGNVGIGTTGPGNKLTVRDTTDNFAVARFAHDGTNGQQFGIIIRTANDQNDTTRYFLRGDGANTQRVALRANGGIANFSANNVNLSDINSKKDINLAAATWDCLKDWEIVNFRYKDQPEDDDLNLGVIAQQVAESCPEVITVFQEATEDQPERLGVKDQQMMWMAIKALQEAQIRIETLEAKVAALEAS